MEKKIKYPFKTFVKNIFLGIILVLTIFCAVPVMNSVINGVGKNDNQEDVIAETESVNTTIYVAGYSDDFSINEVKNETWKYGWFWSKSQQLYMYNGSRVYATTNTAAKDDEIGREYALGQDRQGINLNGTSQVKIVVEKPEKCYVVGIFKGKNNFTPDNLLTTGNIASLTPGETYTVLLSNKNLQIEFVRTSRYMKLGSYQFSGGSFFLNNYLNSDNYVSSTMPKKSELKSSTSKKGYDVNVKIGGKNITISGETSYYVRYVEYSYGRKNMNLYGIGTNNVYQTITSYSTRTWKDTKILTINIDEVWTPQDNNSTPIVWQNDKITYNICSGTDLQIFASDVNSGFLNDLKTTKGIDYRAILRNNIAYSGDVIGSSSGDGVFQGEFDGNGKKIEATITPKYTEIELNFIESGLRARKTNAFGLFSYTKNASVHNLTINVQSAKNAIYRLWNSASKEYQEINDWLVSNYGGLNKYMKNQGDGRLLLGYDGAGALIGNARNTFISDVTIESFTLHVENGPSYFENSSGNGTMYRWGAVVGVMDSGSVSNVTVKGFDAKVFAGAVAQSSDGKAGEDYCLGGLVGYAKSVSLTNNVIESYSVSSSKPSDNDYHGDLWLKHDKSNFYAGGLVGYLLNSTLKNCHVSGGMLNLTGVYFTNTIGVGGLVGYAQGKLENCTSKSLIYVDYLFGTDNGSFNNTPDHACVGGLIGVSNSATLNDCNYENYGKILLKSGGIVYKEGGLWSSLKWDEWHTVVFGGMIGWVQGSTEISNSFVYIGDGFSSTDKADAFAIGGYVGVASNNITISNSYSIIETITTGTVQGKLKDGTGAKFIYAKLGLSKGGGVKTKQTYQKFGNTSYYKDGSGYASDNLSNMLNDVFGGLYKNENNNDKITQVGNRAVNDKSVKLIDGTSITEKVIVPTYGYNIGIQQNWLSTGLSAPFLLGRGNYSSYLNLFIDCTKTGADNTVAISAENQGQWFQYKSEGKTKYLYGAGVLDRANLILPVVKKADAGCKYYSLYPTGRDENGNISIFAYPGEIISGDSENLKLKLENGKQESYTIYPIFENIGILYSPTKLDVVVSEKTTAKNGNTTTYTFKYDGKDYTVSEEKLYTNSSDNSNGIYTYLYSISAPDSGNLNNIKNILVPKNLAENQFWTINENSLNDYASNSGQNNKDNFVINYFNDNMVKADKFTNDYSGNNDRVKTLYAHIYSYSEFYIGKLTNPTVKIGTSYAGEYEKAKNVGMTIDNTEGRVVLFYANLLDDENGKTIHANFEGLKNIDGFGDITVLDELKQSKIAYLSSGMLFINDSGIKEIGKKSENEAYYKLGIFENGNKNIFSQSEYYNFQEGESIIKFYLRYFEPGIIIHYYKNESEDENVINRIEYIVNGDNVVTKYDIKIFDYSWAYGNENRYDFVGWKLKFVSGEFLYVYPGVTNSVEIPKNWVTNAEVVDVKLYPIFITKNGEEIDAFKNNTYQEKNYESINGTQYYPVSSVEDLIYASYLVNFGGKQDVSILLKNNINMIGIENFIPIGFKNIFMGNFNGQGYSISNLNISARIASTKLKFSGESSRFSLETSKVTEEEIYVGLFGKVANSDSNKTLEIKNLSLINAKYTVIDDIDSSKVIAYVGGVVGHGSRLNVSNVLVQSKLFDKSTLGEREITLYLGGICGYIDGTQSKISEINECISSFGADLPNKKSNKQTDSVFLGSIVGYIGDYANIINSFDKCKEDDFVDLDQGATMVSEYHLWYRIKYYKYGIVGRLNTELNSGKYSWAVNNKFENVYTTLKRTNIMDNGIYKGINSYSKFSIADDQQRFNSVYTISKGEDESFDVKSFDFEKDTDSKYSLKTNTIVGITGQEFCDKLNSNSADTKPWSYNQNVNGAMPFLKNTGISNIAFSFDTKEYILTPEDEARFASFIEQGVIKRDGTKYVVTKQIFILDIIDAIKDTLTLDESNLNSSDKAKKQEALNLLTERIEGLNNFYNANIKQLLLVLPDDAKTIFNELEGYVFNKYNLSEKYEGLFSDELLNTLGSIDKNKYSVAQLVDFVLNNSGCEVNIVFNPKSIKVKYVYSFEGENFETTDTKEVHFGELFTINGINLNSLPKSMQEKLVGKEIVGFKIYLPKKGVYLNIFEAENEKEFKYQYSIGDVISENFYYLSENGKLQYVGDYGYTKPENKTKDAKIYAVNSSFVINLIDSLTKDGSVEEYQLQLVVDESAIKNIKYKLNFFKDDLKTELNAFSYQGTNNDYLLDEINGDINYFVKFFSDVLKGNVNGSDINLFPSYYKTGYNFKGWGYYLGNKATTLTTFWNGVDDITMPDLRVSPYNAQSEEFNGEVVYSLDLYPILERKTFNDTRYYDGFTSVTSPDLITYHLPTPVYGNEFTPYNHEKLLQYANYSRHNGYILKEFVFRQSTIDAINSLNSKDKQTVLSSLRNIIRQNSELSDLVDIELNVLNLAKISIIVINYMAKNAKSFEYFLPISIDLVCTYERQNYEVKIVLPNYRNVEMVFNVLDFETKQTSRLSYLNFVEEINENNQNVYVSYINIKHNDIITLYTNIKNGTKINSITHNSTRTDFYSFSSYGLDAKVYAENILPKLSKLVLGTVSGTNVNGIKENLIYYFNIENLNNNQTLSALNGVYQISSAEDLVEYAQNLRNKKYEKAVLTNNINLTGVRLNLNFIPEGYTLDGQGYAINGFSSFGLDLVCLDSRFESNSTDFSFIYVNRGEIKNINFDNVSVNILNSNDDFAIINNNSGLIENVNVLGGNVLINNCKSSSRIGGLVGTNESDGEIINVYCNLNITVTGDKNALVGLISGMNLGLINKAEISADSCVDISGASIDALKNSYVSLLTGASFGGKISNVIVNNAKVVDNSGSINKASIIGYVLDSSERDIKITNIANYSSLDFINASASILVSSYWSWLVKDESVQNITTSTNLKNAMQNFKNSEFVIAVKNHKETIVIPNLNNHIVEFNIKNKNSNSNIAFEEIIENVVATKIDNTQSKIISCQNVINKVAFNSEEYASVLSNNFYVLSIKYLGKYQDNKFNFYYNLNSGEKTDNSSVVFIPFSRQSKTDNVDFEYIAKEYYNFTFKLTFTNSSKFNEDEIEQIKSGIKAFINSKECKINFDNYGGYYYATIMSPDIDDEIAVIRYFDEIKFNFNLPNFAFLSNNGLKVNSKIVEESKQQQNFAFTNIFDADKEEYVAEIDRKAIMLTFDLNTDSLIDNAERGKISFDDEAIKKLFTDKDIKAIKNNAGQLEIEVSPKIVNEKSVYYLPKILDIIDGKTYCIFSYKNSLGEDLNGINYLFNGFIDKNNNSYYDKFFNANQTSFDLTSVLFANYQSVEYEVVVDSVGATCHFTDLNGYSLSGSDAKKTISFSGVVTLPTIEKNMYNNAYRFVGYKLSHSGNEVMISSCDISEVNGKNVVKHILNLGFETLNENYTKYRNENEFKIVLIPVFEEISFEINFEDGQNDEYDAYLYYQDSSLDDNHYDKISINDLTISKILSENFVIPVGFKEHHSFVGFIVKDDTTRNLAIRYDNGKFVFDNSIFMSNITFVAEYEIDKVEVVIDFVDKNTNTKLEYEILSLNDIETKCESYNITEDNKIVFEVDYNTTNFTLPTVKLKDDNYKFLSYAVNSVDFANSYKFTENTEINITCEYKIKFLTKTSEIKTSYELYSNSTFTKEDNSTYSFYAKYGKTINLPKSSEVERAGFALSGFKFNGEDLSFDEEVASSIIVLNFGEVEFIFTGETYTLVLNTEIYKAVLPKTLTSEFVEAYDLTQGNQFEAKIKVLYGTEIEKLKTALPALTANGYTFVGYEFEEESIITKNGTITPNFVKNEFEIIVFDADGTRIDSVTKYFDEVIDDSFYENIKSYAQNKAQTSNSMFKGLSLDKNSFIEFDNPSKMPDLEKVYSDVEVSGNKYSIKVYCYYISNITVIIKANVNTKIENINTEGISNFEGGNAFNASAKFKLSANDIISGNNIVLPLPTVNENSDLIYASFVGYFIDTESQTLVVDALGKILSTFRFDQSEIELTQKFEYNTYSFDLISVYDSVLDDNLYGFEKISNGFTKQIKYSEQILNLPILKLKNYNFAGFYISSTNNILVDSQDIMICDKDGNLQSGFETLNSNYFDKVDDKVTLKNIYAKYENKYNNVVVKSENIKLGYINSVILTDGTTLSSTQIENGFVFKVPSGKDIIITATVNNTVATFNSWLVKLENADVTSTCGIENSLNQSTIIKNVTEDFEIIATFDYINFNITYIVEDEQQNLSPNTFNIDTSEFALPSFDKFGYDFVGWYLEENFINLIETINPIHHTNNLTLYGKLESKKVNLVIYSNNVVGFSVYDTIEITFGKKIENLPNIKVEGYNFVGFFTSRDKKGVKVDNSSLSIFVEDTNVYAIFEQQLENTLSGEGSLKNPFLINSQDDFKVFASLTNFGNLSNKTYFKLSKSIDLNQNIIINSFNANFDGDGYAIYLNNCLNGYNVLNDEGKIVKNISLFGNNFGRIENLIMINNQYSVMDVIAKEEYESVTKQFSFSTLANENLGTIDNCVVYFNISLQDLTLIESEINSFNEFCVNNSLVTNSSVISSVLKDKNNTKTFENSLDKHLISKNTQNINKNSENVYEVNSVKEFAYLLNLTEAEIKIKLTNNLDFRGFVFDKGFNGKVSILGSGYTISNIIALDLTSLFENVEFDKLATEQFVFVNLKENSVVITNSNKIENSYFEFDILNAQNVILQNNGKILNTYFISQNLTNLIKTNNESVKNVYLINLNKFEINNIENFNFEVFELNNLTNVDEFIQNAKTYLTDNNLENLWFKDEYQIMSAYALPKLIGVGNYVVKLIYDENVFDINPVYQNKILGNLVITKDATNMMIMLEIINDQYHLEDILVNSVSKIDEFNQMISCFALAGRTDIVSEVEFVGSLNNYEITVKVNPTGKGNLVSNEGNSGEEIVIDVTSGTKLSDIIISATSGEGYKFVEFDVFDEQGNQILDEEIYVLGNLTIIAKFDELASYTLDFTNYSNINILDTKLADYWTEITQNEYRIYLGINENVLDFVPNISKQDYVFVDYYIVKLDDLVYKVLPNFVEDYVSVELNYDEESGNVIITSEDEFSQNSPELKIVLQDEQESKHYLVLRGYDLILRINFNGSYLTKVLVDDINLFDDYSVFENKEDEVSKNLTLNNVLNSHTINVEFNHIMLETQFEFDEENCSIEFKNAVMDLGSKVVRSKKNSQILFSLNIDESKLLDNFVILNGNDVVEQEIEFNDNVYSYVVNQNAKIKINLKDKTVLVTILTKQGGETSVLESLEKTIIDDNTFSVTLQYNAEINLIVKALDGYRPKVIYVNNKNVELKSLINIKNIIEDTFVSIEFTKLAMWLDVDENNMPIRFNLTNFVGLGTESNPYIISNINSFLTLCYNINIKNIDYSGKFFKATERDLKFNLAKYYFNPIENFNGTILGNNLTLSGVKIYSDSGASLFRKLGSNSLIKAINVEGVIEGNNNVATIAGENNGKILGCSSSAEIKNSNNNYLEINIVAGICAVNNGTISRCYNTGNIDATSKFVAGICAINNGTIDNVYNTGVIKISNNFEMAVASGICCQNNNIIQIGYNNSRVINVSSNSNIEIVGTVKDVSGNYSDLYFNKNMLNSDLNEAKTYTEMLDYENKIYARFSENVWAFDKTKTSLPKLKVCYEYIGNISFIVTFDDNLTDSEKLVLVEISDGEDQNFGLAIKNSNKAYKISNLTKGTYKIRLKSIIGNLVQTDNPLEIVLSEDIGENVEIKITLTKTSPKGYYGYVIV